MLALSPRRRSLERRATAPRVLQWNDLDRIDAGHAGGPRHPPDRFTPVDLEDSIGVTRLLLSTDEPHLAGRDGRLQLVHVDSVELYGDAVILVGFL